MRYDDENKYMKVVTSIPSLKDKIEIDITDPNEKIYWYIKFNLKLDEESVSKKTTTITDTEGYILKTEISYSTKKGIIVISPLEDYEQNVFYILSISKEVRSEKQQNLKDDVHILFKIKNKQISEFKVLPPGVKVPRPRRRPAKFNKPPTSKVYSFEKDEISAEAKDKLPWGDIMINPIFGVIGLLLMLGSIFIGNMVIIIVCAVITLLGIGHIIIQVSRSSFRSNFVYNMGVMNFNKDKFDKAEKCFERALEINPENEYAEYAKNKMRYYK